MVFPIYELEGVKSSQLEQLGTKPKFWFTDSANRLVLFKVGRPNTGENWAEKVCSEICSLIGLPHAKYDLANCDGTEGVITPSFLPPGCRLVHGNELMAKSSPGEEGQMNYSSRQHTVRRVMLQVGIDEIKLPLGHNLPPSIALVPDVFVGYLLLDVLVGNQDRHFENWGLVSVPGDGAFLAPTYDHASSLGRNETDERRHSMLNTRDSGQSLKAYVCRARSMMYPSAGDTRRRLLTSDAFMRAAAIAPAGASYWISKLQALGEDDFENILTQVPNQVITQLARDFAREMLVQNRKRILFEYGLMAGNK